MILWIIKQILSLKKAFTGRANPHELAWGLALGVAIGVVPKGNLISLMFIGLLVTVRVNHGMAALAAVLVSFVAVRLDPWTHALGASVLQSNQTRPMLERLWALPLVPWTAINNTVVMGSTLMAAASIVPTYLITLPIFRYLAPSADSKEAPVTGLPLKQPGSVQQSASPSAPDHLPVPTSIASDGAERAPASAADRIAANDDVEETHVETQIDIIRLQPAEAVESAAQGEVGSNDNSMNEALGYLLRRLRDSRQGKVA